MNVLEILLLSAHLVCVNVAAGGPLVAAWLDWRAGRGDEIAYRAARYLAGWSVAGLLVGAVLGAVIGWLKWNADYRALWLGPLAYKLRWAGIEMLFSLVLLVVWWLWLKARTGRSTTAAATRGMLAVLAASNLLYHLPPLFSVAIRMYDAGETSGEQLRGAAFRRLMIAGETPALVVHVALASLAVGGVMLLALPLRMLRRGDEEQAARVARWGGWWALAPSLAQLPVGLWALTAMPAASQTQIMGTTVAGTLLFAGALIAALWLVSDLARVALGEIARPILVRCMVAMLVTIVLMTAVAQQARVQGPTKQEKGNMNAEIVTIRDAASGSVAEILASQGFNCFRFAANVGGRPVEAIYAPPDFASGQGRPSRGGIPILFPFPGRIHGTSFHWEGKQYELEPGDAFGNAIHGFAMWRPWRVVERSENHAIGQFHAWRDDPSLKVRWPADFRLTATYTLRADTLVAEYLIENPCEVPLPCGFGTHPYFRVPLGGPTADDCIVKLPVCARWELKEMLPTGRRLEMEGAAAFQAGQRFGEMKFDDVFAGLTFAGGWCSSSIRDPASGCTVTQRFDRTFRECVVYTPPHREAICIEPYTCVPGGFDLAQRNIDAGLRIVPPGGSFTAVVEIGVT